MFCGSVVPRLLQHTPRSHTGKGVDLWGACGTEAVNNDWNDGSHTLRIVQDRSADSNGDRDLLKVYSELCGALV